MDTGTGTEAEWVRERGRGQRDWRDDHPTIKDNLKHE